MELPRNSLRTLEEIPEELLKKFSENFRRKSQKHLNEFPMNSRSNSRGFPRGILDVLLEELLCKFPNNSWNNSRDSWGKFHETPKRIPGVILEKFLENSKGNSRGLLEKLPGNSCRNSWRAPRLILGELQQNFSVNWGNFRKAAEGISVKILEKFSE